MSKSPLATEDIIRIIESAFTPLRCVAEDWDYGDRIRFRVFDNTDTPLLTQPDLLRRELSDAGHLAFEGC